jgi:hypothetical protein
VSYRDFLSLCWSDYQKTTPLAYRVEQKLKSLGESIHNDHIAFRTLAHPKVGLVRFEEYLAKFGLVRTGEYRFIEKKLKACHFEIPGDDLAPKIFVSELLLDQLSEKAQGIFAPMIESLPTDFQLSELISKGRAWSASFENYQTLAQESEYAAWLYAWGLRVNHFTVSVNQLKGFEDVASLNQQLKAWDFKLNSSGGEVKGGAAVYLEQSSTMADVGVVKFIEGEREIPSCYYEFAKRFVRPDGTLYNGFVEKSADKIFESTDGGPRGA